MGGKNRPQCGLDWKPCPYLNKKSNLLFVYITLVLSDIYIKLLLTVYIVVLNKFGRVNKSICDHVSLLINPKIFHVTYLGLCNHCVTIKNSRTAICFVMLSINIITYKCKVSSQYLVWNRNALKQKQFFLKIFVYTK